MSFHSPAGLQRKQSAIFDSKLQKQKKDESEQKATRERHQAEYASRHNVQELFTTIAAAITANGQPATEDEANRRIFEFLLRRKQIKEASKRRIKFTQNIRIEVKPNMSMTMEVSPSSSSDVQLHMRNVLSSQYTLDDVVPLTWEQFAQWEAVLGHLAMQAEDLPPTVPQQVLTTIRSDGKVTGYVVADDCPAGKASKKLADKLWNLCMEFRQTSKRVGVFQLL
jgi:hypothetical protein